MTLMTKSGALTLATEPASAAAARAFLREQCTLDSMRHSEADLLVTELIGNVIQHSPKSTELTISVSRDLDLTVSVAHPHPAPIGDVEPGVGFLLLDRLTKNWGHHHDGEALSVWFVLRTPGTTAIPAELSDDELFARMADDPAAYSDELIRRHSDLAASIARRYRGKGLDDEDLLQVAHMALLKAIQRYDASIGSIRPYAAATISGEMKKLLRDRGWSVRVPRSLQERSLEVTRVADELAQKLERPPELEEIAARLDITSSEVAEAMEARQAYASSSMDKRAPDGSGVPLHDRLEDEDIHLVLADDRVVVERAIQELPERQRRILHLRFNEDLTQSEIAEQIGISQMHVSRLLSAALQKLKENIGSEHDLD
jgi:RNA polymerase sigma-B factor